MENQLDNSPKDNNYLVFDYVKSNLFRVIYSDGFIISPAPSNSAETFNLVCWNERLAIPNKEIYKFNSENKDLELEKVISKDGIVREIEVNIILSKSNLIDLRDSLNDIIQNLET